MRRTWKKAKPKLEKRFRVNKQITASEIFLIGENGGQSKVTIEEALAIAREIELDLVEVNPKGTPPVCRIMDYGQFKYEKEKKAHKQRLQQKKVDTKGIRLSVRIGTGDLKLRIEQGIKFLTKGSKLKVDLILKGRERAHPAKAAEVMNAYAAELGKNEDLNIIKEQDLTKQGGRFTMILVNKND